MPATALPDRSVGPGPSEQDELAASHEQLARIAGRQRRPTVRLASPAGVEGKIPAAALVALQAIMRDRELTTKEEADIRNGLAPVRAAWRRTS
jgi:hypothetical protein